jgi:hypothetical protein
MTLLERLERKFERLGPDECWPWVGATWGKGYGVIRNEDQVPEGAHCMAYRLYKGPVPEGMEVCHTCDNPPCVNYNHLFTWTHLENMRDKDNKNRGNYPFGERSGRARLTEELVAQIRKDPRSYIKIAEEMGIPKTTIYYAKSGKTWGHVGEVCHF